MLLVGVLAAVLAGQGSSTDAAEACGGMIGSGVDAEVLWIEGFSVSTSPTPIQWPAELRQAVAVVCKRSSLQVSPNDRYVLDDLGVPFVVANGERMLWLYRADGWIKTHMDDGAPTESEGLAIDQVIGAFNRTADEND